MLDLKYVRDHSDEVREKVERRGVGIDWEGFIKLDISWRELLKEVEGLKYQKNSIGNPSY